MSKMIVSVLFVGLMVGLFTGCTTSVTHKVQYPQSSDLFVTMGDDPGSESAKPYIPKGTFIHVETDAFLPVPVLGMFAKIGESNPQYVFDNIIIPEVRKMGGDALTDAKVQYTPPGSVLSGLFGMRNGGVLVVTGQAVKR
jgi:hypothetical protein